MKSYLIPSANGEVYVQVEYPEKLPAPAIIVSHGLRSYYTGFLNTFAKRLRDAGYISVKFHFIGTGKSSGTFEEKSTATMLKNFEDVLDFVEKLPEVAGMGVMARSNAGTLAIIHGADPRIKAYSLLAPPAYYSRNLEKFVAAAEVKNGFFYHKSFKRPHTKGEGRLPLSYADELRHFDPIVLENASKIGPAILFQSTEDEAVKLAEGHYDYWKEHLPEPRKLVLINGGNHSFKGLKSQVIQQTIEWFQRFLPTPK